MTTVVTELCVDCKYTDCVAVCPVDAFHELPDRLYINPEKCIDCSACVPECPVHAIVEGPDLEKKDLKWITLNAKVGNYPVIAKNIRALHGPNCSRPAG